jgi:hypothetical protein
MMMRKGADMARDKFTVSAEWMKACGLGVQEKTFEVVAVIQTGAPNDFFRTMHKLDIGNRRTWIVAEGRRAKAKDTAVDEKGS